MNVLEALGVEVDKQKKWKKTVAFLKIGKIFSLGELSNRKGHFDD